MMYSDLSSVYRNLERLEALGVVRHVHLDHGPGLYTLQRDSDTDYLVCEH
ncbi:transcriptional repressor [Paraconexibacter antarcticus]|uniref:Transcriptional repressor n=2 Tax=Paraconexibacter antarcticus TaxID=2949664 RepID=A0ABY5DW58_9ACTN|nr:transcriptional repressor [Paraconexibacter antarcticus]